MTDGIKKLRNGYGKRRLELLEHCDNCKCRRYNPCRCTRSDKKKKAQSK